MITLNDYLYSGDTVLKILKKYTEDLRQSAAQTGNEVDVRHCEFLSQIMELLEHNDFLTAQSQKIREFYIYGAGISLSVLYIQRADQVFDPCGVEVQRLCGGVHL